MKYAVYILILLLLFSCRKEETPIFRADPLDGEKAILVGTWQWIYTDYRYDYCNPPTSVQVLTPATENKTYQITFDKEGYVNFDGKDVKRIVFGGWLQSNKLEYSTEYVVSIWLNGSYDMPFGGGVGSDTLLLTGQYISEPFEDKTCAGCCSYTNYFVKI